MSISRRDLLKSAGAAAIFSTVSGFSGLSFANINGTDKRFVFVILRGGMDGLAAVAPYADPDYNTSRGELAYDENEVIDLDGFFGMSTSLSALKPIYDAKQLAVLHAVSLPYRSRSHFDSQNVMENGTALPSGTSGWLNNAMSILGASKTDGIALNQQVPLVLQGALSVGSWAPKDSDFAVELDSSYIKIMSRLYSQDSLLSTPFAAGIESQKMAEASLSPDDLIAAKNARSAEAMVGAANAAAVFLAQQDGPKVAVVEASGWDTHIDQGKVDGKLPSMLKYLGDSIAKIRDILIDGNATEGDVWKKTVVVVVSEFGRTVAQNGTKGTDHGTGGVAFVLGGKVKGGKVLGTWPTLAPDKLYNKGRDLMPTTDTRSIFKTVLVKHFGANPAQVDAKVFPIPSKNPNIDPAGDPVSANVMKAVPMIDGLFA